MTLLDFINSILEKAAPGLIPLSVVLQAIESKYPDTKASIDPILAAMAQPIDPALASEVGSEVWDIVKGHLVPTPHAGDSI